MKKFLNRIRPGLKYFFTGEMELPEGAQKLIKEYFEKSNLIHWRNRTEEQSKKWFEAEGRFYNNIVTYLSEQHWPESYKEHIGENKSHHKKLCNMQRKGTL